MNTKEIRDSKWLSVHGPNLSDNATGYFEIEANELREKILSAPNTEKLYEISGKKYYFSSNGNDLNDGCSPETPIKSLKLLETLPLSVGDAVLFKRNSIYRVDEMINLHSGITYGSFGTGEKPRFYASPRDYAVSNLWTLSDMENIWQTEFSYEEACGMFFDHGKAAGSLWRAGTDALKKNFDFHHDAEKGILYLYFDKGNPADFFSSIEITMKLHKMFRMGAVKDLVFDNICIKYTGGFPIVGSGENITITNCEIGYVGGLWSPIFKVKFGNAIELSQNVVNVRIENNWIYETFDTAITWQGGDDNAIYNNISFSNNLLEYNNADFEFFTSDNAKIDNFVMLNNIMRFTSMGWGTQEEEMGPRWIEGCIRARTDNMEHIGSIEYKDNLMDCPARQVVSWRTIPENKKSFVAKGNKLHIKSSYRTTDMVLHGFSDDAEDTDTFYYANNEQETIEVMKHFENEMEIHWHNE